MFTLNSLFIRTFLFISVSLGITVALFNYFLIENQKEALLNVMYSKAKTVAKSITLVSADAMVESDYSFIIEHTQKVLEDDIEIKYVLVSAKGDASVYQDQKKWSLEQEIPPKLVKFQTDKIKSAIINSSLNEENVYHFSYPVVFSSIKWGWVAVGFSLDEFNANINKAYINSTLFVVVTILASIILSYVLADWLVKPTLQINEAAKKVAGGDLHVALSIDRGDEIGELAQSFNHMVKTLKISDNKLRVSNEELENRVIQRTQELNTLNEDLDHRVKEEVAKRAEQEQLLIHQSRFAAMGEMIGNIAHQWRQPLNALGLLLQNIENAQEMGRLDDAYIQRVVTKGNSLTNSMSQTIDDFRNFFKPNKESAVFEVSAAILSTMEMLGSTLDNNLITVHEEMDKTLCIEGFQSEFSQVLLNIINNAKDALVEHRSENREIFIRVSEEDDKVKLEIEDNAGGIPDSSIKKVFDPYYTTKDEGSGTGIGLYMSKTIIESNMKGALSVRNTQKGALFTVFIKSSECEGES